MMKKKAVFLDRDGTIIEDVGFIGDPAKVRLLPGVADAIRRIAEAGFEIIVVSNQSGVARGIFDEDALSSVHTRMVELLGSQGARLDGAYYCPYLEGPEAVVEAYRCESELRKPEPGMLIQAANERGIDLSQSWMIGDSPCDVEAGRRAGCRTMLLDPEGAFRDDEQINATHTAPSLSEACEFLEPTTKMEPDMKTQTEPAVAASAAVAPRAAASPRAVATSSDDVVRVLGKIHDLLDRSHRQSRQHDFSVVRLFAALIQMFAIVAALWGLLGLMSDLPDDATARLTLACFLQLASISAYVIDRFR